MELASPQRRRPPRGDGPAPQAGTRHRQWRPTGLVDVARGAGSAVLAVWPAGDGQAAGELQTAGGRGGGRRVGAGAGGDLGGMTTTDDPLNGVCRHDR